MVDGKLINILTNNKSTTSCSICDPFTPPSKMNNIIEMITKKTHKQSCEYGLSPLHLLINVLGCILHISYRLTIKSRTVRGEKKKKILEERKIR